MGNSLIASYINYGLLVWGIKSQTPETLQNKDIRLIAKSINNCEHTNALFKQLPLLKIEDLFKFIAPKWYYNLLQDFFPPYFNTYLDITDREHMREIRNHCIHPL